MRRPLLAAVLIPVLLAAGCGPPDPESPALPGTASSCGTKTPPSPKPTPTIRKVDWRAEELPDGSVKMIVGDTRAAPRDPRTVRVADPKHPIRASDCEDARIVKVRGWWCVTTAGKIGVTGEIVVGGAEPRAKLHGAGFSTQCAGRQGRMRQRYRFERDSWSGWRNYTRTAETQWEAGQKQSHPRVETPCPAGRTGTYNYRLWVVVEASGAPVGDSAAISPRIRTDCGTGVS